VDEGGFAFDAGLGIKALGAGGRAFLTFTEVHVQESFGRAFYSFAFALFVFLYVFGSKS